MSDVKARGITRRGVLGATATGAILAGTSTGALLTGGVSPAHAAGSAEIKPGELD